jgi:ClpP class serine protease
MVSGNFDLVDHIASKRGVKPIAGFANEHAYSAGYSLISAVDPGRLSVARTGGVGSIGVVTAHVDYSEAMKNSGVKVTFIHAGKYKVEGNPYETLSDDAKERIQTRIDGLYDIFVSTVARNRGIDEKDVRATEALTFSADEAVSKGLADSVGSLEDAIAAFAADMSNRKDEKMSYTKEQLDAAVAEASATAKIEGVKEGASAERSRISAIVNSEAGAKRPKAALKMATNEKFAAVDGAAIVEMLAELPEEKAQVADAPKGKEGAAADFAAHMDNAQHPQAGAMSEVSAEDQRKARLRAAAAAAGRLKTQ